MVENVRKMKEGLYLLLQAKLEVSQVLDYAIWFQEHILKGSCE